MYIFRGASNRYSGRELLGRLRRSWESAPTPENRLRCLLAAGDLECAIADCVCAANEHEPPILNCARELLLESAAQFVGGDGQHASRRRQPALARLQSWMRHRSFSLSAAEGFRYYALHPSAYAAAARQWRREHPAEGRAWVLGIRTIGSALGAVVAAELARTGLEVRLTTLRPRGLPDDRRYRWTRELETQLRQWQGNFLLVDEGPGLSGSSFAGLVQGLRHLGIAEGRLALLPSWNPQAEQLSHPLAARRWERWRRYPAPPPQPPPGAARNLSAGRWREIFAPGRRIPVWPLQDRMKYLDAAGTKLFKFAGLCDASREAAERSRRLARAGVSLAAREEGDGWISLPVLPARMLFFETCSQLRLAQWAEWAGNYIAWCAVEYRLQPRELPSQELLEMLPTNCRLLQVRAPGMPEPSPGPCCRLDGRMLAEEWGDAGGRFLKFDALDHGDDHFFPGPADPAWDLAGIELELGEPLAEAVRRAYCRRSGDEAVLDRLRWHRPAYAAFRAAFCAFAAQKTTPPDAGWFADRRRRYQRRLESYLAATN